MLLALLLVYSPIARSIDLLAVLQLLRTLLHNRV